MGTPSPVKEPVGPSPANQTKLPESSPNPSTPVVKSEIQPTDPKETSTPVSFRLPESPSTGADVVTVPSYSRWFSWNNIHESEVRFLPEFFDSRSPSKNPMVYKYYRDSIIRKFRENPLRKITFTDVRRMLVGDVGSIRRVFDFLEGWGLINYMGTATKPPSKWEEKENKSGGLFLPSGDLEGSPFESSLPKRESSKKLCSGCKSVCSIACFACDKVGLQSRKSILLGSYSYMREYATLMFTISLFVEQFDLTLCARCYVRGNYRVGVSNSDFRRVEISEEVKTDWSDKETLHLLEAIMHFGDDWKKVAEHVGGRSEKECIARFIKLPFGEQFVGPPDSGEVDKHYQTKDRSDAETGAECIHTSSPTKRRRLTPLADASNPIMAQAAFLSAMVGSEVAEAAARAAVAALSEVDEKGIRESIRSLPDETKQQESAAAGNGDTIMNALDGAVVEAQVLFEKEERDVERSISGIIEVQMKEIQDKIVHFEELELHMEKEWQQLQHAKNLLFVDQLTLLHHRTTPLNIGESIQNENVKTTDAAT
ncbi:hypothetical protein HHK36_008839 [Tetracentron sinense]|uniref:SWI/SNF complex subunit SWI3B n=1 Tax=Tetracentron sinense TaxID=13715 RepID=A0A834ZQU6_TETSI|nr:hypothetical protein HHK36_008839 [Tetracentron sinense]